MTRVLLITGARSLADDPAAEAWARGLIAEALAGVDLLIVGDAPGPDAWAWEAGRGIAGARYCAAPCAAGAVGLRGAWSTDATRWAPPGTSTHPLRRNAAMVADCKRAADNGDNVRVLALLDGRKPAVGQPGEKRPTRGTEHTVGLARAAGLTVRREVWG